MQNVYKKKGWNLTLGFHPYLVNASNSADFFEADYMQEKYHSASHKYLFPTMQDLKSEIDKLKSDLSSLQADNTGKNIENNKEKTTLEDLFRDIM